MIVSVDSLSKFYQQGSVQIEALNNISFNLDKGETVAIVGSSGSGKTTLLSLLAGLDNPSRGSIKLADTEITNLSEQDITKFRAKQLGIIFQQFHLIPYMSAFENVCLPLEITGADNIKAKAQAALQKVGLESRLQHRPDQMSGGECQRVAIARALVTEPDILLADEPSGNLDSETGNTIMKLLFDLVSHNNMTMILVTHNREHAQLCQRTIELHAGKMQ